MDLFQACPVLTFDARPTPKHSVCESHLVVSIQYRCGLFTYKPQSRFLDNMVAGKGTRSEKTRVRYSRRLNLLLAILNY